MFRSTSSSAVGRIESLRINRAPIASFVSCWSFSVCSLRMFRFISSCLSGLIASFSDRLSFFAIFAARSPPPTGSSRYRMGPSFESLSSSSLEFPDPLDEPYGLAFSLFSIVHGKPMPKRIGRELQRDRNCYICVGMNYGWLHPEGSIANNLRWCHLLCHYYNNTISRKYNKSFSCLELKPSGFQESLERPQVLRSRWFPKQTEVMDEHASRQILPHITCQEQLARGKKCLLALINEALQWNARVFCERNNWNCILRHLQQP